MGGPIVCPIPITPNTPPPGGGPRWAAIYNRNKKNFIDNRFIPPPPWPPWGGGQAHNPPFKALSNNIKLNLFLLTPYRQNLKFKVEKVLPLKSKNLKTWYLDKYKKNVFCLKNHSNHSIVINLNLSLYMATNPLKRVSSHIQAYNINLLNLAEPSLHAALRHSLSIFIFKRATPFFK
jgi:hypothetical protein